MALRKVIQFAFCVLFIILLQLKGHGGLQPVCPGLPMCYCKQIKEKLDISCQTVIDLNLISKLLKANYIKKFIDKLTLHPCYIKNLTAQAFTNLSISYFESSCPLEYVEVGAFSDIQNLYTVSLANTVFNTIPPDLVELEHLKSLILTKHNISRFNSELWNLTTLSNFKMSHGPLLELSNQSFTHSSNLTYIDLSYNKLKDLPTDLLDPLKKLRSVNFNGNQLQNVDGLFDNVNPSKIELYSNKLTNAINIFRENMRNVTTVKLGKNPLSSINGSALAGKITNVKDLDLSNCFLSRLDPTLLKTLKSLKEISLEYNLIKDIPIGFFHGLQNLQVVNLNGNSIQLLEDVFLDNPQLRKIYLSYNQISSLDRAFKDLPQLSELYLKKNVIKELHQKQFTNCLELQIIDVSDNRIQAIDSKSFDDLLNLKILNLSKNFFPKFNHSIQNLQKLEELYADICSMDQLNSDELEELPQLSTLSLTGNQISNVNGAFTNLPSLKFLSLGGSFQTLTRDSLPPIMQLKTISLSAPLACDCRLQWFVEWIKKNSSEVIGEPTCYSPERLRNKHLTTLKIEDLIDCPDECECNCEPAGHEAYVRMNCSSRDLHAVPEPVPEGLGELFMDNNLLSNVDNLQLGTLDVLITLDLSNNNLSIFNTSFPRTLETLHLHKNELTGLQVPKQENLKLLTLSGNPWTCDCQTVALKNWIIELGDVVKDGAEIRCDNSTENENVRNAVITSLSDLMLCPKTVTTEMFHYLAIGGAIVVVILAISLSFCCFHNSSTLSAILYEKGCTCIKRKEAADNMEYDAVILHHNIDKQYAASTVKQGLSKKKFAVYILEEDENERLLSIIHTSKRVIIIFSKEYLRDEQCMANFRLVFSSFAQRKLNKILVIKFGNLPSLDGLEKEAKSVLASGACLDYSHKYFWPKLLYFMPKNTYDGKNTSSFDDADDLLLPEQTDS